MPPEEAEMAKRQPCNKTGLRSTPRPSRAPWLLETASQKQQTDHSAGKRPTRDDTGAELDAESRERKLNDLARASTCLACFRGVARPESMHMHGSVASRQDIVVQCLLSRHGCTYRP